MFFKKKCTTLNVKANSGVLVGYHPCSWPSLPGVVTCSVWPLGVGGNSSACDDLGMSFAVLLKFPVL